MGHCPGCAAVPGHDPPTCLDKDHRPLPPSCDKPALLCITADGNTKANRFASAGCTRTDCSQRHESFKEFYSHDHSVVQADVKRLQQASGKVRALLLLPSADSLAVC